MYYYPGLYALIRKTYGLCEIWKKTLTAVYPNYTPHQFESVEQEEVLKKLYAYGYDEIVKTYLANDVEWQDYVTGI
jgi:hypothetical protein